MLTFGLFSIQIIIFLFIIILPTLLWIFALIDILKSDFKDDVNKIIWVLIVILLPILGSILYFILGKTHKIS